MCISTCLIVQGLSFQNAVTYVARSVILSQISRSKERYYASCRQSVGIIEVTEATLMKWFYVTATPPPPLPPAISTIVFIQVNQSCPQPILTFYILHYNDAAVLFVFTGMFIRPRYRLTNYFTIFRQSYVPNNDTHASFL